MLPIFGAASHLEAQLLQTGMDVASPKAKAAESAAPIQPPKVEVPTSSKRIQTEIFSLENSEETLKLLTLGQF